MLDYWALGIIKRIISWKMETFSLYSIISKKNMITKEWMRHICEKLAEEALYHERSIEEPFICCNSYKCPSKADRVAAPWSQIQAATSYNGIYGVTQLVNRQLPATSTRNAHLEKRESLVEIYHMVKQQLETSQIVLDEIVLVPFRSDSHSNSNKTISHLWMKVY